MSTGPGVALPEMPLIMTSGRGVRRGMGIRFRSPLTTDGRDSFCGSRVAGAVELPVRSSGRYVAALADGAPVGRWHVERRGAPAAPATGFAPPESAEICKSLFTMHLLPIGENGQGQRLRRYGQRKDVDNGRDRGSLGPAARSARPGRERAAAPPTLDRPRTDSGPTLCAPETTPRPTRRYPDTHPGPTLN